MKHGNLSDKETKALLQKALNESFPGTKFSIKKDGWCRVSIAWSNGPSVDAVEWIAMWFEGPCVDYESLHRQHGMDEGFVLMDGEMFIASFNHIRTARTFDESNAIQCDAALRHPSPTLDRLGIWDGDEDLDAFTARIAAARAKTDAEKLASELTMMIPKLTPARSSARL